MSINYLILYKRNESLPVALVEFHTSVGNPKVRNLKWIKDNLKIILGYYDNIYCFKY